MSNFDKRKATRKSSLAFLKTLRAEQMRLRITHPIKTVRLSMLEALIEIYEKDLK